MTGRTTILFHVSDLHFGLEDRRALDWFAAEVARVRPAAVICTGDLTMRGRASEFAAAADYLSALPAPVTVEPGNHDMPYYYNPVGRLLRPYRLYHAMTDKVGSGSARTGIAPEIALVPLKTVARAQFRLNWSKGRVGNAGLEAALQGLAHHSGRYAWHRLDPGRKPRAGGIGPGRRGCGAVGPCPRCVRQADCDRGPGHPDDRRRHAIAAPARDTAQLQPARMVGEGWSGRQGAADFLNQKGAARFRTAPFCNQ
jgi:hypothetical protein